jgi:hypothetical protein
MVVNIYMMMMMGDKVAVSWYIVEYWALFAFKINKYSLKSFEKRFASY